MSGSKWPRQVRASAIRLRKERNNEEERSLELGLGVFLAASLAWAAIAGDMVVATSESIGPNSGGMIGGDSPDGGCSTAPTLLAPENGATLATLNPLLRWDAGDDPDATGVQIELCTDPMFSQGVYPYGHWQGQGVSEWHILENLKPCTTHCWRVALRCDSTRGPWSEVWSFTTGCVGTILPGPALVAPEGRALIAALPAVLSWLPVEGALEYHVCWTDVQVPYAAYCA
ncbi:MAG TPA: fibronectin type III domain-containing protein [Anaerolineae bacterium]|nr:fibronectin type III domain-containing protein [Anaerolineae bacterium]